MDNGQQERHIQTVCLLALTAIAIGSALYLLRPVLIPFVLAVFLVYAISPAIDAQTRHMGIGRTIAVINTILLGCIVLVLFWLLAWTSVSQMSVNAPVYEKQFYGLLDYAAEELPLEHFGVDPDEISSVLKLPRDSARSIATKLVSAIMSVLSNGLLVVIFMIFILAGSAVSPPGGLRAEIEARIKRYALTKVLVSGTTGILVGAVLAILGVDFAFVFGVLAFLLNFIPSIGSVISTLLPLPVIVLSPELGLLAKVLAILIPGVIQFAVGNLIEPKIMGESLDLHPVVILLGLIFFGMIWGIVGMFLATPIVAVIKIVLERIEFTGPVARLLSAGKVPP